MNNSHPWRDIYSNAAWDKILEHCGLSSGTMAAAQNPAVGDLTTRIRTYHDIPKNSYTHIIDRKARLWQIQKAAEDYLSKRGAAVVTKPAGGKSLVPGGHIDPWLQSLARRCPKKAGYLDLLVVFYQDGGSAEQSPGVFKTYILRKIHEFTNRQDLLPVVPGVRVEKLDPLHRVIEMKVDATKPWESMWTGGHGLGTYFVSWLLGPDNIPFWLWLEDQPPSTVTPGLDDLGHAVKGIKSVPYGETQADFWVTTPQNGAMSGYTIRSPGAAQVFRTSVFGFGVKAIAMNSQAKNMGGVMGDHGSAYVWSKLGNEIYAAKHVPGQFHHSSFTAGGKVKCAGTWQTNSLGQVTCVTRDSGHYQPSEQHLKQFLRYLNGGYGGPSVLHPNARTFPYSGGGMSVPLFSTWQLISDFIK